MALYFASRGVGKVRRSVTAEPELYTSPARVLLNGLGSDELLGGYGRHRTAYSTGGWKAVVDEVRLTRAVIEFLTLFLRSAPTRDGSHPNAQSWPRRSRDLYTR